LVGCCEPGGKNEKKNNNNPQNEPTVDVSNQKFCQTKLTSVEVGSCEIPMIYKFFSFEKMIHPNGGWIYGGFLVAINR